MMSKCAAHHWVIEPANRRTSGALCLNCGEEKTFKNVGVLEDERKYTPWGAELARHQGILSAEATDAIIAR